MSYQVLARKWRPRDFSTLVGQEHVVRALTHALEQNRLHHAWLFTGTRGVGKTTLSRILAKALNCTGPDGKGGITAQPCGVCRACNEIDTGRFVDYIEMDAASNRGVDEMAQLLEKAIYAPGVGRFKVYMIDEVHMLTNHAFNSMLKTLEEPPEHVKFILATTDPQKIPVTVLSRCLQFNLKQMPPDHIVGHLENILGKEGVPFEANALRLLAKAAQGSMRDALSLTDQAIAYSAGAVCEEAVRGMLGALDQSYLVRIVDALVAQDGAQLIAIADEMAGRSLSFAAALQDLGSLLQRIALAQTVPQAIPDDWPEAADARRLAIALDAQEVQLFYQIANQGRAELALAPDEYAGFTMTLLRMLAFRPAHLPEPGPSTRGSGQDAPIAGSQGARSAALQALGELGRASASLKPATLALQEPSVETTAPSNVNRAHSSKLSPAMAALEAMQQKRDAVGTRGIKPATNLPSTPAPRVPEPATASAAPNIAEAGAAPPWEEIPLDAYAGVAEAVVPPSVPDQSQGSGPFVSETPPARQANMSQSAVEASAPLPAAVCFAGFDGDWPALIADLPLRGLSRELAYQTELRSALETDDAPLTLTLRVPRGQTSDGAVAERFEQCLSEVLGRPVRLIYESGSVSATAAAAAAAVREQRQQEAEQAIDTHPLVQALRREFDATVVPGSVRPL